MHDLFWPTLFFLIEYISNFFHTNEVFILLYQVLVNLGFLYLQINYTSRLNWANFLGFSEKKRDIKRFVENSEG